MINSALASKSDGNALLITKRGGNAVRRRADLANLTGMDTNSEVPAEQKAAVEERDASRDDGGRRDTSPDTNQDDGGLDRSMLDFDPADNYFTGTVVDGTTEIPGPHAFDQKDDKS